MLAVADPQARGQPADVIAQPVKLLFVHWICQAHASQPPPEVLDLFRERQRPRWPRFRLVHCRLPSLGKKDSAEQQNLRVTPEALYALKHICEDEAYFGLPLQPRSRSGSRSASHRRAARP